MTPEEEYEQLKRQNRRRLVGASALVAVAAAILGIAMQGKREPATSTVDVQVGASSVSVPTASQVPETPASESAVMPASEASAVKTEPTAVPASSASSVAQASSVIASAPVQAASHTAVVKSVKPKTKPQPKVHHPTPEEILEGKAANETHERDPEAILNGSTTQARHKAKTSAKTKHAPVRRAVIQVGAYPKASQARKIQEDINGQGLQAFTSTVKTAHGSVTRVRLGPYNSRADAEGALKILRSKGYGGTVLDR